MRTITWATCNGEERAFALRRPNLAEGSRRSTVEGIIAAVTSRGDDALREFTQSFDRCLVGDFKVSHQLLKEAYSRLRDETRLALQTAHDNIKTFHRYQLRSPYQVESSRGITIGRE